MRQVFRQLFKQQLLHTSGGCRQKIHLSVRNTGMAQGSEAILQLHASSRQTWQVQPLLNRATRWPKSTLHQSIHTAVPLVLSIGEHNKRPLQPRRRLHIAAIKLAGQRIPDQLHANAVEILHDQQVINVHELLLQLIRSQTRH